MASTRIVIGLVLTAATAAVALAACSSSTTGTGGDGGASSSGSSSGSNTKLKNCPSSSTSTCTEAENTAYGNCVIDKCDTEFTKCYGADYKNGNFSGACGPYITCTQACACNDTACVTKCAKPTTECSTCLQGFSGCIEKCPAPACASGSSSGSSGSSGTSGTSGTSGGAGKTCADLAACCAKISDATMKKNCTDTYDAIKTSEASCNAAYSGYAPSCP